MFPETLVVLICTFEKSWSCCAIAACPQTSTAPTRETTLQVRIFVLISFLLRKPPGILPLWTVPRSQITPTLRIKRRQRKYVSRIEVRLDFTCSVLAVLHGHNWVTNAAWEFVIGLAFD